MNIFQKFKDEKTYIELLKEHKNLYKTKRNLEINTANKICDHMEKITKINNYKQRILAKFRENPDYMCYDLALLNIIIQALDNKKHILATDFMGNREISYTYKADILEFNDAEMDEFLADYFEEAFEDCRSHDMYSFVLDLSTSKQIESYHGYKTCINVIKDDMEYVQDCQYKDTFAVDGDYERGIRAYHEMIVELKYDIVQIFYQAKEQEKIKLGY